ncbi:MAG TPA: vanadium-dependent haloperoxidase [Candidatus Polarisedimenticolaceae bacterium]|nr:vanadium-dependent haloperoxidase [Candidatus Polarisedimenticolaceae bacterium]
MKRLLRTTCLALTIVTCTGVAGADVVTDWNNHALDAIRATNTNPPRATRALAMVHTAMFDAINGIERVYAPYHVSRPAPPGASPQAAAAWAAYTVLVGLYPDREWEFGEALESSLAGERFGPAQWKGRAFGRYVGRAILTLRADDGADAFVAYAPSGEFGYWQPTPPAFGPALLPQWPAVTPFAMTHGSQFRVPAPPPFDSAEYAAAFEEVRQLGDKSSGTRDPDQTEIAYFWEDGPGTATPPGHWQVIAQQLAEMFDHDLLDNARLFALLSIVQADGAIVSWDNKYHHDYVRPYTAITAEADDDGNPETASDPGWSTLIPSPPFPSYTSGHSTFSGGSARLLGHYFGTDAVSFCAPSPDPQRWPEQLEGVVRCWNSLAEAAEEAGQSRIYGGIHWQYDNQQGLDSGRALADYVWAEFLTPLPQAAEAPRGRGGARWR